MTSPARTSRCDEIVSLIDACLEEVALPPKALLRDDPDSWVRRRGTLQWWKRSAEAFSKHRA